LWKLAVALIVGIAYFLAARLGLALRVRPGIAVFWPAAGVATGALIALGPQARAPIAAAIAIGTIAANLMIARKPWLAVAFGGINAMQTLLTAWLVGRWFEAPFKLENVSQVLGFLTASAVGAAAAACGAAAALSIVQSAASPVDLWRLWFAACLLGTITLAPLVIGIAQFAHELPPRRELIEGTVGVAILIALSIFLISLPEGPWATALPVAFVFPVLLLAAVRCQPVFSATASFVVSIAIIWSLTFDVGHFGDASIPLAERMLAAQTHVLAGALLALILAALFAERRRTEADLRQSRERLQLALDGAELGAFSADLATGHIECDMRLAHIHDHKRPPTTIKESRRFVHPDDLTRLDAAIQAALNTGGICKAEYRVVHPRDHPQAGDVRWVALEASGQRDADAPARLLGVTRDITERKWAERAIAERNTQLALAGKFARVGTFTFDVDSERMQVSPGYATIHGLPEGIEDVARAEWRAGVHPDDLPGVEAQFAQTLAERRREHYCEYRIVRANGETRWIDSRSFIVYGSNGAAPRLIGANIDITQRKQTEAVLSEHEARLADALAVGHVVAFEWDAITGRSRRSGNAAAILGIDVVGDQRHDHATGADPPRNQFLKRVHADDQASLKISIGNLCSARPAYVLNFRFCRPDGHTVWLEETARGEFDATGKLLRIKGLTRDITERKKAELILDERNVLLELAGKAARVGSYTYDLGLDVMQVSEGYVALHGLPEGTTETRRSDWRARVHPEDLARVEDLRRQAFQQRLSEYAVEYRILKPEGEVRWIESRSFVAFKADGSPLRVLGVNIDVTERRRAEDQQRVLVAELDHRVKNVLATVDAILTQTQEGNSSLTDFVAAFGRRIKSLARTHEMLSRSHWRGVSLRELVRREFAPYAENNVEIHGPSVTLRSEAAQAMAMVLHELITNAAKYGSLSNRNGRVLLNWRRRNGSRSGLVFEWQEIGGPRVLLPTQLGYGTSVIRELIPFELDGKVELAFAPEGVKCQMEIPADWVGKIYRPRGDQKGLGALHVPPG
jgi:PAS domain S-box-containing protein